MEIALAILQVLGIYIALPILMGISIAGLFLLWQRSTSAKRVAVGMACSIDADCPPGFVCINGRCVPKTAQ